MKIEQCICCGEIIPKGRIICPLCENSEGERISGLEEDTDHLWKTDIYYRRYSRKSFEDPTW